MAVVLTDTWKQKLEDVCAGREKAYYPPDVNKLGTVESHFVNMLYFPHYKQGIESTGSDPECFMFGKEGGGLVPGFSLALKEPQKYGSAPDRGAVSSNADYYRKWYADGFALESTLPHSYCHAYFTDIMQGWVRQLVEVGEKTGCEPRPEIDYVRVGRKMRVEAPPWASELGCMPSWNGYGEKRVVGRKPGVEVPYRTSGCHLHFGFSWVPLEPEEWPSVSKMGNPEDEVYKDCAKWGDFWGGVLAVALVGHYQSPLRRKLYGRAGEYRVRWMNKNSNGEAVAMNGGRRISFVLEYRSHSSAIYRWPEVFNAVADATRTGVSWGLIMPKMGKEWFEGKVDWNHIRHIINDVDREAALEWIVDGPFRGLWAKMFTRYGDWVPTKGGLKGIVEGLEKRYPKVGAAWGMDGVYSNWASHNNSNVQSFSNAVYRWNIGRL